MTREVQLTNTQMVALVDDDDYELVSAYKWGVHRSGKTWYARSTRDHLQMHRLILGLGARKDNEIETDHKDGNGLNNRRENLRLATRSQNQYNKRIARNNTSGFKGVQVNSRGNWKASIVHEKRFIHLGLFDDPAMAARAYDAKARELFGEFAWLNFPTE